MRNLQVLLAALVLVLALLAPAAQAEDTFYLESDTGVEFWNANMDSLDECWFGPTGSLVYGKAGEDGSIRAEDSNPFNECPDDWGSNMAYSANGGSVGAFGFGAFDPAVGSSSLSCQANGSEWEEGNYYTPIESFMTIEADGHSCTIAWLPGARPSGLARVPLASMGWHSRLTDSLAPVSSGRAKVSVQLFGKGRRAVRDRVTLRTRSGRPIGQAEGTSKLGARAHAIAVPLAPFARERLAEKRELIVRASLTHADGTPGSGDTTKWLLLRGARAE